MNMIQILKSQTIKMWCPITTVGQTKMSNVEQNITIIM